MFRKVAVIVKLFNLFAKMFDFKRTATPPPKADVQLHARIDRKGKFVDIITIDPTTLLEKTETP